MGHLSLSACDDDMMPYTYIEDGIELSKLSHINITHRCSGREEQGYVVRTKRG